MTEQEWLENSYRFDERNDFMREVKEDEE